MRLKFDELELPVFSRKVSEADIADAFKEAGVTIVVLDDDPTGNQTVYGVPVLTNWSLEILEREFLNETPLFFILTNTRSMPEGQAVKLTQQIVAYLQVASQKTGKELLVISRGDSTLRGHFPAEVEPLRVLSGYEQAPMILIPMFFQGGRYTIDDTHYVKEGNELIPAGDTPFAMDSAFGFKTSDLKEWVAEKCGRKLTDMSFVSVAIEDIRSGGVDLVCEKLVAAPPKSFIVINAVDEADLKIFALAYYKALKQGKSYLFRTAASILPVLAGMVSQNLLNLKDVSAKCANGSLFIVGSYVPKTTRQLQKLFENENINAVEIDVNQLVEADGAVAVVQKASKMINELISQGRDVVLFTSRKLLKTSGAAANLQIGRTISDALIAIVKNLEVRPRLILSKGGITSSDIATLALGVERVVVKGQVLPGVPVWLLGEETSFPGLYYIVFPGNVGDDDSLAKVYSQIY